MDYAEIYVARCGRKFTTHCEGVQHERECDECAQADEVDEGDEDGNGDRDDRQER